MWHDVPVNVTINNVFEFRCDAFPGHREAVSVATHIHRFLALEDALVEEVSAISFYVVTYNAVEDGADCC